MSFSILTDTSANLPTPMLQSHQITAIPFSYFINDVENICTDTEAFDGAEYYGKIRGGVRVTTSQINPQRYIDHMEPILKEGNDILFIGMSSGISSSFHSAELAARQLKEVYPERKLELVDTMGASLGEGLPVLRAVKLRDSGLSLEETAQKTRAVCRRMYQVFTADDLMHLRRSGRVSGAVAIVGTVLQIKPLLKGNEHGQIVNFGKVRGRKKSVEMLAEKYEELAVNAKEQTVGIAYADCEQDAQYLSQLLRRKNPPKEILTVCYEPVTGSHVGPGALALFFEGGDDVRTK